MEARWWAWLGSVSMLDVASWLFGIGVILGAVVGTVREWRRRVTPWLRRLRVFLSDWSGEPDRPGVPGRDGVMKQLQSHGRELAKQSAQLDEHSRRLGELQSRMATVDRSAHSAAFNSVPNHGSSFADEILRQFKALHDRLDAIENGSDSAPTDQRQG